MKEKIFVIGGGQMGSQIAALSAIAGYETTIFDSDVENLKNKIKFSDQNIKNLVSKHKYSEEQYDSFQKNLQIVENIEDSLNETTFVIEAVVEKYEVKNEIFKNISKKLDKSVVIASNSSFLPASELSIDCDYPERFINMHFFYPPLRMDLIEISYPSVLSKENLERTIEVSKNMGRTVVILKKETPGFIVNRMLSALIDEAYELYDEGIADFEDIDIAIKKGLNHPLGPFELSDYSGLDIYYYSKLKQYNETQNEKDRPKTFIEEKVKKGDLGVKTGKGFYDYKND